MIDQLGNGLQILIISLPSQTGRRSFQSAQMERLGLAFRFWPATQPAEVAPEDMATRIAGWARPLRPTEVACLLSHRSVWAEVAKGTSPTLVLEDDAVLSESTQLLLPSLARMADVDVLNLETFREKKLLGKTATLTLAGRWAVFPLYRDRGGAACYLLWPSGAAKLLAYTENFSPLADAAINLVPGLRRLQIVPALAVQEMHLGTHKGTLESGVVSAGSRPRSATLGGWLRGRRIRLYTSLRVAIAAWRHLFSATTRDVPVSDD